MTRISFFVPVLYLLCCLISTSSFAQNDIKSQLSQSPVHPRLLLLKGEEGLIRQSISSNAYWAKIHQAILQESDSIIGLHPIERIKIGRRLLKRSREALRRVFYLSYSYRMTGLMKYAERAEREMLAISNFSDWNPSHFLDVAEMTMAVSIGYDWLFDQLTPSSKQTIRDAIIKKGILPSFDAKDGWFVTANHNWNQVCNAGMVYGALAVCKDSLDLATKVVQRALNTIHLPMDEYKPDGAYPEGYSYWEYGTSFNVLFLSAIDKIFHSDFGLCQSQGFLKTGSFLLNMTGTTGECFNWGDCGPGEHLNAAMFWFAQKNNDPSLLWVEKHYLDGNDYSRHTKDRLLPAILIWGKDIPLEQIVAPRSNVWVGQGANPVAMMRTSWSDPNGIYLGFKAGSSSVNHGHMDVGSFVMEADGVRWASDFGSQEYESLESKGISIFGRTQDAQRWSIFRINNFTHNTLSFNNQLQQVKGYAKIDQSSDRPKFSYFISDLTSVYENQISSAQRGVAIVDSKYVLVRDELRALGNKTTVRWILQTQATPEITSKNTIRLTKNGKSLSIKIVSSAKFTIKTWPSESGTNYDAPNPRTSLLGFELELEANQKAAIDVYLIPGSSQNIKADFHQELKSWSSMGK